MGKNINNAVFLILILIVGLFVSAFISSLIFNFFFEPNISTLFTKVPLYAKFELDQAIRINVVGLDDCTLYVLKYEDAIPMRIVRCANTVTINSTGGSSDIQ